MSNRVNYCIANFKMNIGIQSMLSEYFNELTSWKISDNKNIKIVVAPPFTILHSASKILSNHQLKIEIASQNVNDNNYGAFTGEVSAEMIKDCKVDYTIVGHSERRTLYKETNNQINSKILKLKNYDIIPIICIGETLEERSSNKTDQILTNQLTEGLKTINDSNFIIAYEPVWAIGTGKTATSEMIIDTHMLIRNILNDIGFDGQKISILYGGSVNRNNAKQLISLNDVDGFLIGGASLDVNHFYDIYKYIEESI